MKKLSKLSLSLYCFAFIGLYQCGQASSNENLEKESNNDAYVVSEKDIEKIKYTEYALSDYSIKLTKDWKSFNNLQTHIESLKKGILSFFKDDKTVLKSFIEDLKNEIPEDLNKSSISVRLKVLETALYKFYETINFQNSSKESILEDIAFLLTTYSNTVYQINKEAELDAQKVIKP